MLAFCSQIASTLDKPDSLSRNARCALARKGVEAQPLIQSSVNTPDCVELALQSCALSACNLLAVFVCCSSLRQALLQRLVYQLRPDMVRAVGWFLSGAGVSRSGCARAELVF